ncbi:hypothetical protein OOJ91_13630 [Micromonospora lupini]|uniref:hypothetical protein n=1 Tax=Micromonospora lupini TaxID=285679 RepID=UPI00225898D5|nr:hypothetical protein [Micromonospora lupini]MCX5066887.1 hypothetical protein [Micromonospora lupini]
MEPIVSDLAQQLDAANEQLTTAVTALSGLQDDVRIIVNRVPEGDAEAQAAADRVVSTVSALTSGLAAFRAETPDADGSDTPTEPTDPGTDPGEPETFSRR